MMTLRQRLEAIWNDPHVLCPNHIVWWHNTGERGYQMHGLNYSRGRKCVGVNKIKYRLIGRWPRVQGKDYQ